MRYYRNISLHGLLTCSFMFHELMANFFFFLMPAMCCYQIQNYSVAVVTRPRKMGCVLVTQGKMNQRDECVKVHTEVCSKGNILVL